MWAIYICAFCCQGRERKRKEDSQSYNSGITVTSDVLLNNWMDTCEVTWRGEQCLDADAGCSAGQIRCCFRLLAQIWRAYDRWFRCQPRKHLKAKGCSSVVWSHWWGLNTMLKALCSGWDGREGKVSPLDLPVQGSETGLCSGFIKTDSEGVWHFCVHIASLLSPALVRLSQSYYKELQVGGFCVIGCRRQWIKPAQAEDVSVFPSHSTSGKFTPWVNRHVPVQCLQKFSP